MATENETSNGTVVDRLADHPRLVGVLFALLLVLNQGLVTVQGSGGSSTCGV